MISFTLNIKGADDIYSQHPGSRVIIRGGLGADVVLANMPIGDFVSGASRVTIDEFPPYSLWLDYLDEFGGSWQEQAIYYGPADFASFGRWTWDTTLLDPSYHNPQALIGGGRNLVLASVVVAAYGALLLLLRKRK